MNSAWFKLAETFGAFIGLLFGIYFTYWRVRQSRMAADLRLEDNPERCGRHEEAIKSLREQVQKYCEENREDHRQIFGQLGALSVEMAKLERNRKP